MERKSAGGLSLNPGSDTKFYQESLHSSLPLMYSSNTTSFSLECPWWSSNNFNFREPQSLSTHLVKTLVDRMRKTNKAPLSHTMEKALATHSSTPAWKIPWTEEPGRLQSMGSLRVGNHWPTSLSLFTFLHWRRKWQSTPVSLPGESQAQGAWWAAVYGVAQSWTRLKQDTTEAA